MSPTDEVFISCSLDNTMRLWDLRTQPCQVSWAARAEWTSLLSKGSLNNSSAAIAAFDRTGMAFGIAFGAKMLKLFDIRQYAAVCCLDCNAFFNWEPLGSVSVYKLAAWLSSWSQQHAILAEQQVACSRHALWWTLCSRHLRVSFSPQTSRSSQRHGSSSIILLFIFSLSEHQFKANICAWLASCSVWQHWWLFERLLD